MPGNLLCMEEKWPKGQHRFLMVPPGLSRTRTKEHWEAGDKAARRRGGRGSVGVARYVTIFAQKHPPWKGQWTTDYRRRLLPETTPGGGRQCGRPLTVASPATATSTCPLCTNKKSVLSLGNGTVPWRPTGRRVAS